VTINYSNNSIVFLYLQLLRLKILKIIVFFFCNSFILESIL